MSFNPALAWRLAWRRLIHQQMITIATILGVTLGMVVIGSILIIDDNSSEQPRFGESLTEFPGAPIASPGSSWNQRDPSASVTRVYFERGPVAKTPGFEGFPTQKGEMRSGFSAHSPPKRRGEQDYQAMRLAVRLAAMLAFFVGAVIVFYTMRFSTVSRAREFSLLLCLGEERHNVALSLFLEALALGITGTLLGLLLAFPVAAALIEAGISTTGRVPSEVFTVPWIELAAIGSLSIITALLGVLGPIRTFYRMQIADILQPQIISEGMDQHTLQLQGFAWLLPPLATVGWVVARPFIQSWLSVVHFFLVESLFVLILAIAALWWMQPLLRGVIRLTEKVLKPLLPLDALLVTRRMRLTSQKLALTVAGVTLVFSLLTALHDITRALKDEIHTWAGEALYPYVYFKRQESGAWDEERFQQLLKERNIHFFRLSEKAKGEFPVRLIAATDINPVRIAADTPPLIPGSVILSQTLAARFDVHPGDRLVIDTRGHTQRFMLIDVTDKDGFYAEDGQYVDLKSYVLFSDGNSLFADTLEPTLGRYAMARKADGSHFSRADIGALQPFYHFVRRGARLGEWQTAEIDRDFLIFDFVLFMMVVLATVGVANSILIQVYARKREFSVLRTLGMSRIQTMRMLLVEGVVIGLVGAALALVLGNIIGAISIAFLDRFTLFEYRFSFSFTASVMITLLMLLTCTLAAIYPALVANRISSAESLHYE